MYGILPLDVDDDNDALSSLPEDMSSNNSSNPNHTDI